MIPTTWEDIKYRHGMGKLWWTLQGINRGILGYPIQAVVYLAVLIAPERVSNYLGERSQRKLEELEAEHGLE